MTMTLRFFFFFNDTATTEIYTLSLHDALPISFFSARRRDRYVGSSSSALTTQSARSPSSSSGAFPRRSEEHTSELQSLAYLVCRLLLEKKKNKTMTTLYLLCHLYVLLLS